MDASEAVQEHWSDLLEDMAATAEGFREQGWEVLELHPGDVTVDSEALALDVLVPDNEFERLEGMVAQGSFDEHDVYRTAAGAVFLLVVARDGGSERAVCWPAYYDPADAAELKRRSREEGHLHTRLRRLSGEAVEFTHGEPSLFFE